MTTVFDMPLNDLPPTTDRATLTAKRKMVETELVIDYAHWGALIDNNLSALEEQDEDGVIAFKAFLRTAVDFPRINDDLLYAGLQKIAGFDNMLGVHAENDFVTAYLRKQLEAAGRTDRRAWNKSRPPEQEMEAIGRSIFWAKAAGAQLYICHISLSDAVQLVRKAAAEGQRVTAKPAPITFTSIWRTISASARGCAPPRRSARARRSRSFGDACCAARST